MNTTTISRAAAYAWLEAYESQLEQCDQLDDIATTAFADIVTAGSGLDERLVQLAVQDMADDVLGACRPPVGMTKAEVRDCTGFTPFVLHQAALLRGALKAFFEERVASEDEDESAENRPTCVIIPRRPGMSAEEHARLFDVAASMLRVKLAPTIDPEQRNVVADDYEPATA